MIIPDVDGRNDYVGDTSTTQFPYDFAIVDEKEIEVLLDGVTLLLNSDYTVSGVGDEGGGFVTITPTPGVVSITLLRNQEFSQLSVYQNNEDFPQKRLEKDLNKVVRTLQQLKELSGRALMFAKKSILSGPFLPDGEVDKILQWETTTKLRNVATTVFVPGAVTLPLSIANGGTSAATAAAARTALATPGLADENTFTKRQHWSKGADISSASTLSPGTDGNYFHVTGTVAVLQIAAAGPSPVFFEFDGILTLTHDATKLILRDAANINTSVGSVFGFIYEGGLIFREIFRSQTPASSILLGHLGGLGVTNNVADATNDIDVAIGEAVSDDAVITSRVLMNAGAMTKQIDAVWAAGSAAGGRDSGDNLTGAKTFHVYIFRRGSGVDDFFISTSLTPTLPSSGTNKRRIRSLWWTGSALDGEVQDGDWIGKKVTTLTTNTTNPGTAAVSATLTGVPTGITVEAVFNSYISDPTLSLTLHCSDLAVTDEAPSPTAAPLAESGDLTADIVTAVSFNYQRHRIRTDTSARVRYRMGASGASTIIRLVPIGYYDRRGRG